MKQEKLNPTIFFVHSLTLLFFTLPLILDRPDGSLELIWLLYLLPPILVSYHHGYKGALVAGFSGILLQTCYELSEYQLNKEVFELKNFVVAFSISFGIAAVTLGMGLLLRKLEKRQQELRELSYNLDYLANHDFLTGLPNRRWFEKKVEEALRSSGTNKKALIFLDINRFKYINDTLGHSAGDKTLAEIASRLKHTVSSNDLIARLGGDEFSILINDAPSRNEVVFQLERFIAAIEQPITYNDKELKVTASFGVSLYPLDGTDLDSLMKYADMAMYNAKGRKSNIYEFYKPQLNEDLLKQNNLEQHLHDAIKKNQLILHYQPIINLLTRKVVGAEALIRWDHPEIGLISPNEFIPLAEETGLILPISEWVLRSATREAKKWHDNGDFIRISVNISCTQFQEMHCVNSIQQILKETNFDPNFLELEITERVAMSNPVDVIQTLNRLKKLGIQIAMDDFGTGYSSLNYLKKYPLNTVKIDRSFIQDIAVEPRDRALLEAMLVLSKNLGFVTIAEGLETEEQLTVLHELDCNFAQGYLFSKPLSPQEFYRFLKEFNTIPSYKQKEVC